MLCLTLSSASAYSSGNCDAAIHVVDRYLALDLQGEGTHTSNKMAKLIDYQGRDTPGWDSFVLTGESQVKDCRESGGHVVFTISHRVFGSMDASQHAELDILMARPLKEEETTLRLNKTPQGWKIDSPSVYEPHVGVAAAKKMRASGQH
jgi:hypothetical protein